MSVRVKLIAIILFVALVPLGVSAFASLDLYQSAYETQLRQTRLMAAQVRAKNVQQWLDNAGERIASVATQISWASLTPAEQAGALTLIYQQMDDVAVTLLLDQRGEPLGSAILVTPGEPPIGRHPTISEDQVDRLIARRTRSPSAAWALGGLVRGGQSNQPLLVLSVPVTGSDEAWTLLVGLSLRALCGDFAPQGEGQLDVVIIDERARTVCAGADASALIRGTEASGASLGGDDARFFGYRNDRGQHLLAVAVRIAARWTIIAQQRESLVNRPAREVQQRTLWWLGVSLLIALIVGWYLARGFSRPLLALTSGAEELAQGNTSYRVPEKGRDELGRLARAFNHMSEEIHRRDQQIREWNAQLEERVETRTRELADAQQLLLQSQTVAAMSSLAAGMAHEINNPLTAVLGMTQVLKRRAAKQGQADSVSPLLERIESEAVRIRDIVATLRTLVETPGSEALEPIDSNELIEQVVALIKSRASDAEVTVTCALQDDVPTLWGRPSPLRKVLLHVLNNALAATSAGGRIVIGSRQLDDKLVKWTVSDSGRGIAEEHLARVFEPFFTTKTDWRGKGLGLTLAYRIVREHQGHIAIASEAGHGTTVTVTLPIANRSAHLV